MIKLLLWISFLALTGCASLSSREATIACQAADTITTLLALNHGAREANPLMAGVIKSFGYPGFLLTKFAVTWFLLDRREEHPEAVAAANIITCGAAVHNIGVIK